MTTEIIEAVEANITAEAAPILTAETFDISIHDAIVTIHNPKTGGYRTFKVQTQAKDAKFAPGERIVSLMVGPDNGNDYISFAFVKGKQVVVWNKFRGKFDSERSEHEKFANMLEVSDYWAAKGVRYLIEGRCRRCHRRLTRPDSLATGYGPECVKK